MARFWFRLWCVCSFLLWALPAGAAGYVPPPIAGHVTDAAGKLSADDIGRLNVKLAEYRKCSSNHVAVFVARSLEGYVVEDVAYATFNAWKVGATGKDNGVLLVIAPAERKVRIETGKGVGGELTDLQAKEILRERVSPRLAAGDFFGAVDGGTTGIELALGGCVTQAPAARGPAPAPSSPGVAFEPPPPAPSLPLYLPVTIGVLGVLLLVAMRSSIFVRAFFALWGLGFIVIPYFVLGRDVLYVVIALLLGLNAYHWYRRFRPAQPRDPNLHDFYASSSSSSSSSSPFESSSSSSSSSSFGSSSDSGYSGGGGSSGGGGASDSY